jgi:receptor-type tyrosine-protein phosphatase gamma
MYATIHSMTNVSAVVDWSRPSNPNGVIEGYRLYFLHGNFTDVKTIKSRDPRVDYVLTNLGKNNTKV